MSRIRLCTGVVSDDKGRTWACDWQTRSLTGKCNRHRVPGEPPSLVEPERYPDKAIPLGDLPHGDS